jgi:hypothetical protein
LLGGGLEVAGEKIKKGFKVPEKYQLTSASMKNDS